MPFYVVPRLSPTIDTGTGSPLPVMRGLLRTVDRAAYPTAEAAETAAPARYPDRPWLVVEAPDVSRALRETVSADLAAAVLRGKGVSAPPPHPES